MMYCLFEPETTWPFSIERSSRYGQSVAGAISTATHGTGVRLGGLATQVVGLDVVTADGSVVSCSASEEPEVLDRPQDRAREQHDQFARVILGVAVSVEDQLFRRRREAGAERAARHGFGTD